MNKSDLKGLWISVEILINKELSDKEKIILSMILYLSKDTGHCFATNNYFSDILNVTVVSISRIINSLKKKNLSKQAIKEWYLKNKNSSSFNWVEEEKEI